MRLLIFTSRFPFPLDKGDKLRAYHQICELSKNNTIFLISLSKKSINPSHINELNKYCKEIHVFKLKKWKIALNLFAGFFSDKPFQVKYFYQKTIHKQVKKLIKNINPDHIYCQLIRCSAYVQHEYHYKKTLDYMDALSKGIERRIGLAGWLKPLFKIEAKRLVKFENLAFEYFDNHTIISEQDRSYIFHENKSSISIISNGIDSTYFTPQNSQPEFDLVFVGNLSYPPNVNSAQYICRELIPELEQRKPDISVLFSGANPSKSVLSLQKKNIKVMGWTEDIRSAYSSGKIFLAPMHIGTGLQNKLLEAMSMELPCITSPLANQALGAKNGQEIYVGNSKEDYVQLILDLLNNKSLCKSLGKAGRSFIKTHFNWTSSTKKLEQIMNSSNE